MCCILCSTVDTKGCGWKDSSVFACCFYCFKSKFNFFQLHSRNTLPLKLEATNLSAFEINRLLLISLSADVWWLFSFALCSWMGNASLIWEGICFQWVSNCYLFKFNFQKSGYEVVHDTKIKKSHWFPSIYLCVWGFFCFCFLKKLA